MSTDILFDFFSIGTDNCFGRSIKTDLIWKEIENQVIYDYFEEESEEDRENRESSYHWIESGCFTVPIQK